MENDLGPPAEDAMMTSEKRIEIGTTWPSYHSHSLQSADINANQALQQPAQPLQGSPDRPSSVPQQGRRDIIFLKRPQPSSKYILHIEKANSSESRARISETISRSSSGPRFCCASSLRMSSCLSCWTIPKQLKLLRYCVSAGIQCAIISLWGTTAIRDISKYC